MIVYRVVGPESVYTKYGRTVWPSISEWYDNWVLNDSISSGKEEDGSTVVR